MMTDDWTALRQPIVQQFIQEHEGKDSYQLALQAKKHPNIPVQLVAQQIQARQKAKSKLSEWYQTQGIIFPSRLAMEQCSSQATAEYKSSLVSGKTAVDLTGGAGVDTYYLSQSFERADYVEQNPDLAAIAQHNFSQLGTSTIQTHIGDAKTFLSSANPVDLIYLDPARRDYTNQKVFRLSDCSPNVIQLLPQLLKKAKQVMIKTSPMLDINQATQDLGSVQEVHIVVVNNECKEVLYLLSREVNQPSQITAIDLTSSASPLIFTHQEEAEATAALAEPQQFIYEPNAAILKAGAFRTVAQRWNVAKLHPNTHLYTSEKLVPDFPGRSFRLETVLPYQKKAVQAHIPGKKANITTRNFSDSVATVRKKLGLKEGGNTYLFATRTMTKERIVLITQKTSNS
ncbi:class I SAM-dependent methyltransferase [Tunicatimonas pelagia]|uniref:class I SAM-dependent methyltransferase n=1 Tax=Tunicatimonas pelagia TaxID=931531 RepID=UPI002666F439|nr:class I SAM-dependent methyltransferase [Tunicatimonas pelagia]WKN41419.1 RsmD family RNA methyltransferase [Tunicatimonas pelagia]